MNVKVTRVMKIKSVSIKKVALNAKVIWLLIYFKSMKNGQFSFTKLGGKKTLSKSEVKAEADYKSKKLLFQRSIIIGVTLLCTLSAFFSRQYILMVLAFSFGLLIITIIDWNQFQCCVLNKAKINLRQINYTFCYCF